MRSPPPRLALVPRGPDTEPSDDELMALAMAGRTAAFTRLVERHQSAARRVCSVICHDETLARDVAQDVFLQVWRLRSEYRPRGRFREFLFTLVRNQAQKSLRKRKLLSLFGLAPEPRDEPVADSEVESLEQEQLRVLVAAALKRLPEQFRLPLVLRFVEELSYEEIAAVIARTPSAARSRVHYGLKALNELLPEEVR